MYPVSPVISPEFEADEVVYAKNQPQYRPLPSIKTKDGIVLTRWRLSEEEKAAVCAGADIMLSVHTFNNSLQPVRIEVAGDLLQMATTMGLIYTGRSEPLKKALL